MDRAIFDSLAKELCEFKIHITSELKSLGVGQGYRDQLNESKEENDELRREIQSKEKIINFLLEKITDKPNLCDGKCQQTNFNIKKKVRVIICKTSIVNLLQLVKKLNITHIPKNCKMTFLYAIDLITV